MDIYTLYVPVKYLPNFKAIATINLQLNYNYFINNKYTISIYRWNKCGSAYIEYRSMQILCRIFDLLC